MSNADVISDVLPPKPQEPLPSDCCGTGCTPCVYDLYDQEVKIWEAECLKIKIKLHSETNNTNGVEPVLSDCQYRPFTVSDINVISPNTKTFTFKIEGSKSLNLKCGQHIVVKDTINDTCITRQYTPISPLNAPGFFKLLIKMYDDGKMSACAKNWKVGQEILIRGPCGSFLYQPNAHRKIILLAGGTGIAPIVQIVRSVLENENDETILRLIYSNKTYSDILLKTIIDEWNAFWNFSTLYVLTSDREENVKKAYTDNILYGRISIDTIKEELSNISDGYCLICGTKSFDKDMINYCKQLGLPYHKF